jgi:hypothetical protein
MTHQRLDKSRVLNYREQWLMDQRLTYPRVGRSYWMYERVDMDRQRSSWALTHRHPARGSRIRREADRLAFAAGLAERQPADERYHGRWLVVSESDRSLVLERLQYREHEPWRIHLARARAFLRRMM